MWLSDFITGVLLQEVVVEIRLSGVSQPFFEVFLARPRMEFIIVVEAFAELVVAAMVGFFD